MSKQGILVSRAGIRIPHDEAQRVIKLAAERGGISVKNLLTSREPSPTRLRWVVMACFRRAKYSYPAIGVAMRCDHSTALLGVRYAEQFPLNSIVDGLWEAAQLAPAPEALADSLVRSQRAVQQSIDEGERPFDVAVARLDRALSEIMLQAKLPQDDADTATLRHHAGDLILSGIAILRRLDRLDDLPPEKK